MNNSIKKWEFVFVPSFKLITVDITLRLLICLFFLTQDYKDYFSLPFVTVSNILTSAIIFNVAMRNRKAICSFMEMRLISESVNIVNGKLGYNQVIIKTRIWKLKSNYKLVTIFLISPILASCPLLLGKISMKAIILGVFVFCLQTLFLFIYRNNFISKKIISIKLNGEKYDPERREEIVKFLNRNSVGNVIKYLSDANDVIILSLQTKIRIYRERLEHISFEAIFLGALTFATFGQLISSEKNYIGLQLIIKQINEAKLINILSLQGDKLIPLIIVGSLLSSVFYVVLLLKRFTILRTIELAQLKTEVANSWNVREEYQVNNSNNLNFSSDMKFTEQIQSELSNANKICSEILSNLNILGFMRLLGLSCFFFVLLFSAKLLHREIFLIVLIITTYGILITLLINKSGIELRKIVPKRWSVLLNQSKNFQHVLSKNEKL